ncbi:hypothetical protein M0802_009853 [Mischocyttarus mexicanus]|nr:hypothetical protein M0802_009853 [Mischocyttarus mexicanus]
MWADHGTMDGIVTKSEWKAEGDRKWRDGESTQHEEGSPEITGGRPVQHRKLRSILSAPRNLRRQQDNNSVAYSALGLNELDDERPSETEFYVYETK